MTTRALYIVLLFHWFGVLGCGHAQSDANVPAPAPEPESHAAIESAAALNIAAEEAFDVSNEENENLDDLEVVQSTALQACVDAQESLASGDVAQALEHVDRAYELLLALPEDNGHAQAKQDIRLMISRTIQQAYDERQGDRVASTASHDLSFALVDNEHVAREIKSFTTVERQSFLAAYQRSGRYRPMILSKLEEAGLPSQLSWLPLVESLFKVNALSRASALGLWQFIASTGLRYGLQRDAWRDERLDPFKSTDAAIAYLSDLHRMFGDWQKALAAYNCGENRVMRLQKRSENEFLDFWDLYLQLPDETRRYVPRLIATLKIIETPEEYGLTLPDPDEPLPETETLMVERSVKLGALDAAIGLPAGTLAMLNPSLRHGATPKAKYGLQVPVGYDANAVETVASLPEYQPPKPQYVYHRVRSGETLSTIAQRYRTTISLLVRVNNLRSANRIWPGQRLRIPVRG